MFGIVIPKIEDIKACAQVYVDAYKTEPWNEIYEVSDVEKYIANYLDSDTKCCFVLVEGEKIKGVALGLIVPSLSAPYLRLEDFCVAASEHRKGYGSVFMQLLSTEAVKLGCDLVILGTQKNYPSHHFYMKNGFQEIESILLFREIK